MSPRLLSDLEFVAGALVAAFTLADVFATILVPGPSRTPLRLAGRLSYLTLPLGRRFSARLKSPGQRPTNAFAPALSIFAALCWLLMLLTGFALMMHASAALFTPPLSRFDDALYVAGSSLLTLGVSEVDAHGGARWLILTSALAGFAVITATVSFILQVQAGLHQREPHVLSLAGLAGKPPSGIAILETYGALGIRDELAGFFYDWRKWSADLAHSHVSYPVLAHFHSADAESDWLAALEAVLDAATLVMALLDDRAVGAATLMHRSGSRAISELCKVFSLDAVDRDETPRGDIAQAVERLASAGYAPKRDAHLAARLRVLRNDYSARIAALGAYLGADRTRLVPD